MISAWSLSVWISLTFLIDPCDPLRSDPQEGFTNVETAAHGLECVEKLLLFREVTLVRWKKWMELEHGDASRMQHFLTRQDAESKKDDTELQKRVSVEAQVLTHALLDQVSTCTHSTRLEKECAAQLHAGPDATSSF